ncbi:MAG: DNA repair protein RadC [Candidatus Aenigmarchaeota archaeon]|nr:DNA repair protein RadC [Candidatus Aenigmarchaeota archaeon]
MRYGPEKLSNSELLAILLRSGKKGENVVELAGKILKKFRADKLPYLTFDELKDYPGLGLAKTCEIVACFELGKRLLRSKKARIYLKPKEVWEELKDIKDNKKEHFVIFYLDSRNQEIKREIISVSSLNANLVHPREVFEPAVINLAAQIILAYNHPSGDPEPSEDEITITKRLVEAGNGYRSSRPYYCRKNGYFSFRETNLI